MRIIARLDVKNEYVIKGVQMEGLRKIGNPNEMARNYYAGGIDEIIFIDCVASLYDRPSIFPILRRASEEIFVPITIGGGIKSLDDVEAALDAGADKVAINTAATRAPALITEVAKRYGSQCVVGSIQSKKSSDSWEAYVDAGRERTGLRVVEWARRLEELGAGELLITSVDRDGTRSGFDVEVIAAVNQEVGIPVVAAGGFGKLEHATELLRRAEPSGICFSSVLHYNKMSVDQLKAIPGIQRGRSSR
ncbi:imidazole glycerol phosphate synthase subunit HisF [Bradyrhizobium symbiodeficiens]|uniref:imidazole glycerol phosphate synthase subunit HisF n=1 Tax=Bradyrhizobium symbiodeficiens TaxID=1404367 RepID=UPI00140F70C1|nr:imidazole glycerol phosphate synthase cyclase subunit [Bradyrhizobium symbiodeficiens]QIP01748.1 imidazole glycerol phosphate synthase subunit HisF [Bradyrhizobium symbiodeficiens]